MAKKTEIVIQIAPNGSINADVTSGPGGAGCLDELDKLFEDLGKRTKTEKKSDAWRQGVGECQRTSKS